MYRLDKRCQTLKKNKQPKLTICCWFFGFLTKSGTLNVVTASITSANNKPSRQSADKSATLFFDFTRSK